MPPPAQAMFRKTSGKQDRVKGAHSERCKITGQVVHQVAGEMQEQAGNTAAPWLGRAGAFKIQSLEPWQVNLVSVNNGLSPST